MATTTAIYTDPPNTIITYQTTWPATEIDNNFYTLYPPYTYPTHYTTTSPISFTRVEQPPNDPAGSDYWKDMFAKLVKEMEEKEKKESDFKLWMQEFEYA